VHQEEYYRLTTELQAAEAERERANALAAGATDGGVESMLRSFHEATIAQTASLPQGAEVQQAFTAMSDLLRGIMAAKQMAEKTAAEAAATAATAAATAAQAALELADRTAAAAAAPAPTTTHTGGAGATAVPKPTAPKPPSPGPATQSGGSSSSTSGGKSKKNEYAIEDLLVPTRNQRARRAAAEKMELDKL